MLQLTDPDAGFRVLSLQRMAQGERWRTEAMRSYGRPVLLWFTRGQGSVTISGTTRGYGPHHAIVRPAGTMHGLAMMGSRDRSEHVRTEAHKLDIPFGAGVSPHFLFSHPRMLNTPDVARIILTNLNENLRLLEDVFHIGGQDYHLAISKWRHL